jgi:hypothetical protein
MTKSNACAVTSTVPIGLFRAGGGPLLPGRGLRGYLLVLVILAMAGPIVAADLFWVGESSDTNNPTSGTWTNSTLVAWSDGSSASANAARTERMASAFPPPSAW